MNKIDQINYLTQPMSVGAIISRAWRIYRINFLKIFTYSFILITVLVTIGLLAKPPEVPTIIIISGYLIKFPELAILLLFILPTIFNLIFIKAFSDILNSKYTYLKDFLTLFKQKFGTLLKYCFFLIVEVAFFIIIDAILYISIGLVMGLIIDTIEKVFLSHSSSFDALMFLAFFTFLLYTIFFFILFTSQVFFCINQLISIVIEGQPVRFSIVRAIDIFFFSPLRFMIFSLILSSLCIALYINIHACIYFVLNLLFLFPFSETTIIKTNYIALESTFDLVGFSIGIALVWPIIISSLTLYYYDIKIRNDGLDLLNGLREGNIS
ncbi:MAG: hypothetical protein AB1782_06125 [Cyanobacteriota bacterium]